MKLQEWRLRVQQCFPLSFLNELQSVVLEYVVPQLRFSAQELDNLMALSGVYGRVILSLSYAKASVPLGITYAKASVPLGITYAKASVLLGIEPIKSKSKKVAGPALTKSIVERKVVDVGPHDYLWPEIATMTPNALIKLACLEHILCVQHLQPLCWLNDPEWLTKRFTVIPRTQNLDEIVEDVAILLEQVFTSYRESLLLDNNLTSIIVMEKTPTRDSILLRREVPVEAGIQLRKFRREGIQETTIIVHTDPTLSITLLDIFDRIDSSRHWWRSNKLVLTDIDAETGTPIITIT